MKHHIIWSDYYNNYEENEQYVSEGYELNYGNKWEDVSESEKMDFISNTWNMYLNDERENLDINVDGRIIAIADLGVWCGRCIGYKIFNSNIKEILYSDCDSCEWFFDGYNIKSKQTHHDGTNYLEYRIIKNENNIENFMDKIHSGEKISRSILNYYTKSLAKYIKPVYGW